MERNPLADACAALAAHAESADAEPVWPAASWDAVRRAGVLGWVVPPAQGGAGLAPADLLAGYAELAGACLTTCFLLSQRDAACRRLRDAPNQGPAEELLPGLARGETFATVGLSQLTTSRQHVSPALVARPDRDGFRLDGVMPWVTGAARADYLVTGAVHVDGPQLLLVVPRWAPGLSVGPPLPLAALQGSLTAEVRCEGTPVERRWLLAGPAAQVMPPGRGAGSLETSALALGLAGAAVDFLDSEGRRRPEWRASAAACRASLDALWRRLRHLSTAGGSPEEGARLRAQANALVLHASQLGLAAGKGTAFLRSHPAQRWARQALFFLVWSCPRPALEGTLDYLAPPAVE